MLCQCSGIVVAALLELQELMRDIERGQHGDAIHALRARGRADLAHLCIEITRGGEQPDAFIEKPFSVSGLEGAIQAALRGEKLD